MVIGITAGGPPPPPKSLREAMGGTPPELATMAVSRRAPSTDVQIFLTTLQDQQARDVWELGRPRSPWRYPWTSAGPW